VVEVKTGPGFGPIVPRKLADLLPYAKNPRTHDADQIELLKRSMQEFGFTDPILVDERGEIIGGHGRLMAAQALGIAEVPTQEALGWSEDKKRAYRILENKAVERGGWHDDFLREEVALLDAAEFDLLLTGFGEEELREILEEPEPEDSAEDECEAPPETAVTVAGDLWVLGRHRLLCGDSTSAADVGRLLEGGRADMLFTDPPYGVNYEGGHLNSSDAKKLRGDDSAQLYAEFLPVALRFLDGPAYMWFAHSKAHEVFAALKVNRCEVSAVLVWHKTNATYAAMNSQYKQRHEPCVYFKGSGSTLRWVGKADESTLWEAQRDPANTMHPTQKPVCLAERAIRNHDVAIVLDLFGGSGSTLIACEKTKRGARVMEIEPGYCDVIVKRWQSYTGQTATLGGDGRTFEEVQTARIA